MESVIFELRTDVLFELGAYPCIVYTMDVTTMKNTIQNGLHGFLSIFNIV